MVLWFVVRYGSANASASAVWYYGGTELNTICMYYCLLCMYCTVLRKIVLYNVNHKRGPGLAFFPSYLPYYLLLTTYYLLYK